MKENVVKISISANVAGRKLDVQGATISLGVNAIPTIELECAPWSGSGASELKPKVAKPTLSDFSDLYKDLAKDAEGLSKTGGVDIEVRATGYKPDRDKISLNGWIMSGVGMSNISANAAPHLVVILQHPICKLTKVGSVYETLKTDMSISLNAATGSCGNLIEIADAVYSLVAKSDSSFWPSPNRFPPMFRHALGQEEYKPSKYLSWSGGNGIFLAVGESGGQIKRRLAQATARLVLPPSNGSSAWDMIIGASGQVLTSVTQDERHNFTTDKLVLEPTTPWKECSIDLDEEDCFWTEAPGVNPLKVSGVMADKFGPYCPCASLGLVRNGNPNKESPVEECMYSPISNPEISDGRIMKTSCPMVLQSAFRLDAVSGDPVVTLGAADANKALKECYNDLIERYCKAVFQITACSMSTAKAQMALWFRGSNGKLILPGQTCRLTTAGLGYVYHGYIRNVVHTLSTGGGCSTTVAMSYVRSTPDFKIGGQSAISAGDKNAAYA